MTAKRVLLPMAVSVAALLLLAACGGGFGPTGGATVSLSSVVSYLVESEGPAARSFSADQIMTGELSATNTSTGETSTFAWSIYLDEETLETQSNKTVVLDPGTYDFEMVVQSGDYQYAGRTLMATLVDGENTVELVLRPVIGDTVADVEIIGRLADFRFAYDPAELAVLDDPRIGISVDGAGERIFDINPATGLSEHMFLNLEPGDYSIVLRVYDAGLQRGKSVAAQESVTVVPGANVRMDLVALHGEIAFDLSEGGGEATFDVSLPGEVVNEAGGVGELQALLRVVGDENPLQEAVLSLSTTDGGETYEGTASFGDFQFGLVTVSVEFTDTGDGQPLGTAVGSVDLNKNDQSVVLRLILRRRALVTGSLLATLGINVFNESSEPVPGAVVTIDGEEVGITGSGSFGTPGYLKIYSVAGTRTVRAVEGNLFGEDQVDLGPLGVHNLDLVLENPVTIPGSDPDAVIVENPDGSVVVSHQIRNIDGDGDGQVDDLRVSRVRFDVTAGTTVIFDSLVLEVRESDHAPVDLNGDGIITGFDNYMVLFSGASRLAANDDWPTNSGFNRDGSQHRYDSVIGYTFASSGTYTITVGQLAYPDSMGLAGYHTDRTYRDYPVLFGAVSPPGYDYGPWQLTLRPSGGSLSSVYVVADGF